MRQVDVFDSLMVRWFRGLTRDFWAENAEKISWRSVFANLCHSVGLSNSVILEERTISSRNVPTGIGPIESHDVRTKF
jgi:hypothetical protein